jgi:hypothetical protein
LDLGTRLLEAKWEPSSFCFGTPTKLIFVVNL